jgi:ATP-dependent Clp protease ATP-binding subunit ClpB
MTALKAVRGSQRVTTANPEATYEALSKYAINMTERASSGKMDPVIGRNEKFGESFVFSRVVQKIILF